MNTLLTFDQQEVLFAKGLATRKYDDAKGLVTYKYHRRVMFDNLWNKYPETLECRGHVYSLEDTRIIQAPPRKSFNYLENGHWQGLPLDTPVRYMKKYNGFMAAVTIHEGQRIISTTGTTNSQYVSMAAKYIDSLDPNGIVEDFHQLYTDLFEIIHEDDPHIVDEGTPRAIHLGFRDKITGCYYPEQYQFGTIQSLINLQKTDRGEGFMAWLTTDAACLSPAKFKTDYYVGKKKLMRMTNNNTATMFANLRVDKLPFMWQHSVLKICKTFSLYEWQALSDQERRNFLESLE